MPLAEPEALEHAGADAPERLQRLDRRAGEDGQPGIRTLDRSIGVRDAPGHAVLGLHRAAPHGDHAGQEPASRKPARLPSTTCSATSRSYWFPAPFGISTRQCRESTTRGRTI